MKRLASLGALALMVSVSGQALAGSNVWKPEAISAASVPDLLGMGKEALLSGESDHAITALSEVVARKPSDGRHQALLALAWQMRGQNDAPAIDMALAGYDLAARTEPGQFWPAAMAGRAAFDKGQYDQALNHLARAVLLRPTDARAIAALASAAYMSGDTGLAQLAADRAVALSPQDQGIVRLAVLSAAANGDSAATKAQMAKLQPGSAEGAALQVRVDQLLRTAALDNEAVKLPVQSMGGAPGEEGRITPPSPDQISLDVAIILSQNTRNERSGINLLDGLSLQYGAKRDATRTFSVDAAGAESNSYQRVLTASISVPQLNYNLNLFNRGGQYYQVVSRPQLTAYRGEESNFFVGRTVKVAVGGVNTSSLEQIDVGIDMRVRPIEITPDGTRIRIETGRSFVTSDPVGSFKEALTTFRQKVAATAEVRFGETLLLSGLTESVDDKSFSKTPILGDLPTVGNFFNERHLNQRRDSVLILVTPHRPISLPGRDFARAGHVRTLADLWTKVIDPMSNAEVAATRLSRMRIFTRMSRGDVSMPLPNAGQAAGEMLGELLLPER